MSSIDPRRSGMPPFFQTLYANLTSLIQFVITCVFPQYTGSARFVSPNGNNTTGATWATAFHLPSSAMAVSSPRDVIFVEGGYTYDENATLDGLVCNVDQILVRSIGVRRATITNTDVTNNGAAVTVTGRKVILDYIKMQKGEVVSTGAAALRFNGVASNLAYNCIMIVGNAATHVGIHFTGACGGCIVRGDDVSMSAVVGMGVGTAVHFESAIRCGVSKTGMGLTTTGVLYSAGARWCSVSDDNLIQTVTTGISLEAGATSNILLATILEATIQIRNLSGNGTNVMEPDRGKVHADVTLDGSGDYDIFTVRGEVKINHIYAIVTTATPAATTAANLQLFPAGGPAIQLTALAGSDISNLPIGSVISKDQAAANAITVADSTNGALIEAVGFIFAEFVVIQKTGGIATTIRLNVTEVGASGVLHFEAHWTPLSDDGALEPI